MTEQPALNLPTANLSSENGGYNLWGNFSSDPPPVFYPNHHFSTKFQFFAWGVVGTCIAILGLIGNILSICVLCHRRMRSSTSCYLTALSIYDCVVLLSQVLFFGLFSVERQTGWPTNFSQFFPYIQPFAYPLALTAQTSSIYTTVGFTVERYIAVCLPLTSAKTCTISRARKATLLILAASVIYNIPRAFENYTLKTFDPRTNVTVVTFASTAFGKDRTYSFVYLILMNLAFMLLIPFTVLIVLNCLLIRAVNQSACTQGRITNRQRHENNLTVMLLSVVIVFLVCQILPIVDNICAVLNPTSNNPPMIILTTISCLMVTLNSAINFYLYCVFGRKFRQVFCLIFCRCRHANTRGQSMHNHSLTTGSIYHKTNASMKKTPRNPPQQAKENGIADKYSYKRLHANSTGTFTKETVM